MNNLPSCAALLCIRYVWEVGGHCTLIPDVNFKYNFLYGKLSIVLFMNKRLRNIFLHLHISKSSHLMLNIGTRIRPECPILSVIIICLLRRLQDILKLFKNIANCLI